jgi:nicotinamidase-related amidase
MKIAEMALLLVDVQRDFWQPLRGEPCFAAFPANIAALLARARANDLLIVHTQAVFQADGSDWMLFYRARGSIPCLAGTEGHRFEDFAAPRAGEPIVLKHTFDGFCNTNLAAILHYRGIKALLIAGLETSVCVLFTATTAYLNRVVPIVVADACADKPDRHEATLRAYGGLCFQTCRTAQVRNDLPGLAGLAGRFAEADIVQPRPADV